MAPNPLAIATLMQLSLISLTGHYVYHVILRCDRKIKMMHTSARVIAMTEIIYAQQQTERIANAPHGEQDKLLKSMRAILLTTAQPQKTCSTNCLVLSIHQLFSGLTIPT